MYEYFSHALMATALKPEAASSATASGGKLERSFQILVHSEDCVIAAGCGIMPSLWQ